MHCQLELGDSVLNVGESMDDWPAHGLVAQIYVEDSDELFKRAVNAGAKEIMPMTDMFFGKSHSACPLYRQVYNQVRQAILEQKLPAGARLPSTRVLARTLGVSRNTILNAYEALVADALLTARKGSGTHVRTPSDNIRSLATPMRRSFDLWASLREARFPIISACLRDLDGNFLYLHR